MVNAKLGLFLLSILFCIYTAAFFVSMAALEMSVWAMFAIVLAATLSKSTALPVFEKNGLEWLFLCLMVVVTIGYFLNYQEAQARLVFGGIRWIFSFYMLTAVIKKYISRPKLLLLSYLIGLSVACIYGFVTVQTGWDWVRKRPVEYFSEGDYFRAVSFLGFPMTWGHTLAIAVPFIFCLLLHFPFRRVWQRVGVGIVFLLAVSNLFLTYTRGAWLGALGAFVVYSYLRSRKAFVVTMLGFALCLGGAFAFSGSFRNRVSAGLDISDASLSGRIELWQANLVMFIEHPLFGVGLNSNEDIVDEYHLRLGRPEAFHGHAHNQFIQYLSGTGILGFTLFMGFFIYIFYQTWSTTQKLNRRATQGSTSTIEKINRSLILGSLCAQVSFHIGSLTECNFKAMTVNHHFVFQLALALVIIEISRQQLSRSEV